MMSSISDKQYVRAYHSAGLWFVGMYMETFLLRLDELADKDLNKMLIEELYDNGENTFDKNIGGTRTRVNSLYKIIQSGREIEALEQVIKASKVSNKNPQAILDAKDLLSRIKLGTFRYHR